MALIEVPEALARRLREAAEKQGVPLELLATLILSRGFDPETRIEAYRELFRRYLGEAEELYRRGEYAQAGEKLWGAIAALLNIVGELEGRPHYRHSDYWEIVEEVAEATGDPEYSTLFALAERLHANFYHAFLKPRTFDAHWKGAKRLVEKLRRYLREKHGLSV